MKRLRTVLQVAIGATLGLLVGVLAFKHSQRVLDSRSVELVARELLGKHESSVLAEFDDMLAPAGEATVRLLDGTRQVAFGIIVRRNGWIISKASELPDAGLVCRLPNGKKLDVTEKEIFEAHDLALLKVEAKNLKLPTWRERRVEAGTILLAAGSGDTGAIALGLASVEERSMTHRGKGFLGLGLEPAAGGKGVRITHVVPGFPAAISGLRRGDVLLKLEGADVGTVTQFIDAISAKSPGTKVRILRRRGGSSTTVNVELADRFSFFDGFSASIPVDETQAMGGRLSDRRDDFPVVLQTDLILAPEQCGGPAVDLNGEVVGINIARGTRVRSLVIPSPVLLDLVDDYFSEKGGGSRNP
ncbi:MAG: PDZ domain-containing protein [Verrucomicrobiota bacterium]